MISNFSNFQQPFKTTLFAGVCPELMVSNGRVIYSRDSSNGRYLVNTYATTLCHDLHERNGEYKLRCLDSEEWDDPPPTCTKSNEFSFAYLRVHTKQNSAKLSFPLNGDVFCRFYRITRKQKKSSSKMIPKWELPPVTSDFRALHATD